MTIRIQTNATIDGVPVLIVRILPTDRHSQVEAHLKILAS